MASINKLSVRGIRSFSPEDAEQVLEFYMPLTVIVGEWFDLIWFDVDLICFDLIWFDVVWRLSVKIQSTVAF